MEKRLQVPHLGLGQALRVCQGCLSPHLRAHWERLERDGNWPLSTSQEGILSSLHSACKEVYPQPTYPQDLPWIKSWGRVRWSQCCIQDGEGAEEGMGASWPASQVDSVHLHPGGGGWPPGSEEGREQARRDPLSLGEGPSPTRQSLLQENRTLSRRPHQ